MNSVWWWCTAPSCASQIPPFNKNALVSINLLNKTWSASVMKSNEFSTLFAYIECQSVLMPSSLWQKPILVDLNEWFQRDFLRKPIFFSTKISSFKEIFFLIKILYISVRLWHKAEIMSIPIHSNVYKDSAWCW